METFDIAIIGAGVAGLSVASEVSAAGRSVLVLEKNSSFGQEASSRNSEVIHAGIYYQPGSLKAVACVEGRKLLYDLCRKTGIGAQKVGKVIVAAEPRETDHLEALRAKAAASGVDLTLLSRAEVKKLEPHVVCVAGLYSAETGIIDSHRLMEYYLEKARANGADLICRAEVTGLRKEGNYFKLTVDNQGEQLELLSRVVINCAGLNADKIAACAGIDISKEGYEMYPLKGSYFRLSDKYRGLTRHLVYPVPLKNSLGVHTVLDLSGGIRLGPDEEEIREIDYRVAEAKRRPFFESVRKFLPDVAEEDLSPDTSGIRAQLRRPNRGDFKDFIISHEKDKGLTGLVNLVGIESPGLTASLYIARYAAAMVPL